MFSFWFGWTKPAAPVSLRSPITVCYQWLLDLHASDAIRWLKVKQHLMWRVKSQPRVVPLSGNIIKNCSQRVKTSLYATKLQQDWKCFILSAQVEGTRTERRRQQDVLCPYQTIYICPSRRCSLKMFGALLYRQTSFLWHYCPSTAQRPYSYAGARL